MKTFIVTYSHNYGLGVAIINTTNLEKAHKLCSKSDSIWDNYTIKELDTSIEVDVLSEY